MMIFSLNFAVTLAIMAPKEVMLVIVFLGEYLLSTDFPTNVYT